MSKCYGCDKESKLVEGLCIDCYDCDTAIYGDLACAWCEAYSLKLTDDNTFSNKEIYKCSKCNKLTHSFPVEYKNKRYNFEDLFK